MESLYRAQQQMKVLKKKEAVLEDSIVEELAQQARMSTANMNAQKQKERIAQLEEDIRQLQVEMAEVQLLIDYYQTSGADVMHVNDLTMLVWESKRLDSQEDVEAANTTLIEKVNRWSENNFKLRVTSLLIATPGSFFGVLEGSQTAVEQVFRLIQNDARHHRCSKMFVQRCESRRYPVGVKLHLVTDELLADIMEEIQFRAIGAAKFCPQGALNAVHQGADPFAILPTENERAILCVTLDALGGLVHHADRYMAAASTVETIAGKLSGMIVERFGEHMTIIFDKHTSHPATAAVEAAKRLYKEVPYCVLAVHMGEVALASQPFVTAIGDGLRDTVRLLQLAEHQRRPLIITPAAHERCSKAEHKFLTYTLDNVLYYTLTAVGEERLPVPEDPVVVQDYSPQDEVVLKSPMNTNPFIDASAEEVEEKRKKDALVKGCPTDNEMTLLFRQLDIGNCGWVSKEKFREHLLKSGKFPLFEHDLKRLDMWLERYNALGDNRLSFQEFSILCLKMEQQ